MITITLSLEEAMAAQMGWAGISYEHNPNCKEALLPLIEKIADEVRKFIKMNSDQFFPKKLYDLSLPNPSRTKKK